MDVFVCYDGDKIGRRVGRAVLRDDVGEVRKVDQAINAGNDLWKHFAVKVGGSVIEVGGDEGRIVVDASRLHEMPGVAQRYAETVGATVSVGVGMRMSESAQALVIAKLRGGNQIVVWDDEMAAEYQQAVAEPKTEEQKIHDEYLAKAQPPGAKEATGSATATHGGQLDQNMAGKIRGAHAGFATQHKPGFTDVKPGGGPEASPPATPQPAQPAQPVEQGSTGGDFEDQLHDAAQDQSSKDQDDVKNSGDHAEDVKKAVTDALKKVRQQLPFIAQLQQQSPDAYSAVMGLVQGVILLGKEVMSKNPPPDDEEPDHVKEALGKAELPTTPPANGEMGMSEESVEKDEAPSLQPAPQHRDLPPGSVVNGAIKVKHGDGKESWKQVRAGMVQAQEPGVPLIGANSHPTSSREPSAN